ncbi:hypothetical protein [Stenotrophomonas sp. SrG]
MEQPADLLGWAATLVLVATLGRQIYKQHQAGSAEGVSCSPPWWDRSSR